MNSTNEVNIPDSLDDIFAYLEEKKDMLIERLSEFVEYQTVSSDPTKLEYSFKMTEYLAKTLKKFQMISTMVPIETDGPAGRNMLPPIVMAETPFDPAKRTVLFYGHFDVPPMTPQDSFNENPFFLTISSGGTEMYGKGVSVSKGPLLSLINAIGAYQCAGQSIPVNVKIVLDPFGADESQDTSKFLKKRCDPFFDRVDFVCLCSGQWLANNKPCVAHACRGFCYFFVQVEGPSRDLDSCRFGGLMNEPMADLVYLLDQLVDKEGNIKISEIYHDVLPVSKEEKDQMKKVDYNVRHFKEYVGAKEFLANEDKTSLLVNFWRKPSLSIHGIEGAFSQEGVRSLIPRKVIGKFSINLVPKMTPEKVKTKIFDHLREAWKLRKSNNKVSVQMCIGKPVWFTRQDDENCVAARNAIKRVYNIEPDLIMESKRIAIATTLHKMTKASVVGIPVGKFSDISNKHPEKLDVQNYINGAKVFASYLQELATILPKSEKICYCKQSGTHEGCLCETALVETEESDLVAKEIFPITPLAFDDFPNGNEPTEPIWIRVNKSNVEVKKKTAELRRLLDDFQSPQSRLKQQKELTKLQVNISDNKGISTEFEDVEGEKGTKNQFVNPPSTLISANSYAVNMKIVGKTKSLKNSSPSLKQSQSKDAFPEQLKEAKNTSTARILSSKSKVNSISKTSLPPKTETKIIPGVDTKIDRKIDSSLQKTITDTFVVEIITGQQANSQPNIPNQNEEKNGAE